MKLILIIIVALIALPVAAHEGEDHGDAPPVRVSSETPQRLPDGSIYFPKASQYQIKIRTELMKEESHQASTVLTGKIAMDPNAGGRVQALVGGRVEPGPQGLPLIGQKVWKGQVLAYVAQPMSQLEKSGQRAQIAELNAAKSLAEKRRDRLKGLGDSVPKRDLESLESEIQSIEERLSIFERGIVTKDVLTAPVDGIIASSHVVAGQVVEARELLYEVVDTTRYYVEAIAFEPIPRVTNASTVVNNTPVDLQFIGQATSLKNNALPLSFSLRNKLGSKLALGQVVDVYVSSGKTIVGFKVPQTAIVKNQSNQHIVWIKTGPETFAQKVIHFSALDGAYVAVTAGLRPQDRVVTDSVDLLNQVR